MRNSRKAYDLHQENVTPQKGSKSDQGMKTKEKYWLTFAGEYRTLLTMPNKFFKEKLEAIKRDDYGWFNKTKNTNFTNTLYVQKHKKSG